MNVKNCEYLLAIAEKKNLSEAAKSLGVSQPTLSTFLSNTERSLKQILFVRSSKGFVPTQAGIIYLEACQKIVEVKRRTHQSIAALANDFSDHFTVGVTPHRGSTLFSLAFSECYHHYPDIAIHVKEGYVRSLLEDMEGGEVDLILGAACKGDLKKYGFVQHNLEELYLCVPDFHPLAALAGPLDGPRISIDIQRFQDTPFVAWGSGTSNRQIIQELFDEVHMTPTVVYESNNVLLIDNLIQEGIGVGFLPAAYCHPNQKRVYFSTNPPLVSRIGAFYRKDKPLTDPQRYFLYLVTKRRLLQPDTTAPDLNDMAIELLNEFGEGETWTPDN